MTVMGGAPRPPADRSKLDAAEAALCDIDKRRKDEDADFCREEAALERRRRAAQMAYMSARKAATATICRKCYIHPAIFNGYLDGTLMQALKQRAEERLAEPKSALTAEEVLVIGFLSEGLGNKLQQVACSTNRRRARRRAIAQS